MTSPDKVMKNIWMKVVLQYQSSTMLQGNDIVSLIPKVAKQWQLRSNGHLTQMSLHHDVTSDDSSLQN